MSRYMLFLWITMASIGYVFAADTDVSTTGTKRSRLTSEQTDEPQLTHLGEASKSKKQIYAIPTYDAAFKWVLSHSGVRPSFFKAFIPGVAIAESERLDEHMNPLEKLQTLREFLHKEETLKTVSTLSGAGAVVYRPPMSGVSAEKDEAATAFLNEMVGRFDEIKSSFPRPRYDGTMDFVCKLDSGDYALIEMQVIPQDYWDRRALAYVAAFYGSQLSRGQSWKHIRKVIGINILGGGKDEKVHWVDTPDHFMRHYRFEDQLNGKCRYIDGIELIQYSIMNRPSADITQEQQDWVTFFKEAHRMSEDDVRKKIKTPAVLEAFEWAKLVKMPASVQDAYEAEDKEYDRYSQHTASLITDGINEEKTRMAKALMNEGMQDAIIVRTTGLTLEQIKALRDLGVS